MKIWVSKFPQPWELHMYGRQPALFITNGICGSPPRSEKTSAVFRMNKGREWYNLFDFENLQVVSAAYKNTLGKPENFTDSACLRIFKGTVSPA